MGAVCGAERDDLAANLRWQRRAGGKLWRGFRTALFPAGPGGRDCGPVRRLEPATGSRDPQGDGPGDEEIRSSEPANRVGLRGPLEMRDAQIDSDAAALFFFPDNRRQCRSGL
jgi:hypothetical protein